MKLGTNDLRLILNRGTRTGKLYSVGGHVVFDFEARNRTVNDGQYGHWGNCPPGEFILGKPVAKHEPPFGFHFILMEDYAGHTAMADHGRAGIGLHGGGSGLVNPFAPRQGWVITHGCWRLQNADLEHLVHVITPLQHVGGTIFVTVEPPTPGAEPANLQGDIVVDEAELDADE